MTLWDFDHRPPQRPATLNGYLDYVVDKYEYLKASIKAKDEKIQQDRNVLAEAARELLHCSLDEHSRSWISALEIARFIGYESEFNYERVEAFLSSVSVKEIESNA